VVPGRRMPLRHLTSQLVRVLVPMLLALWASAALAQGVAIPGFWDPKSQPERVELGPRTVRFLTDDEYPPLHFAGPDGAPTGFAVELARAACERLAITCLVQVRRFDTLLDGLAAGQGDVVAAAVPLNAALRARFVATNPYFRLPARFVARLAPGVAAPALPEPSPAALAGRTVGVAAGTAHEAYLKAFFPAATLRSFADLTLAEAALKRGEVETVFGDGLGLALWLGGTEAAGCCGFVGGPYLESRYFGEGIGFVLRPEDATLRRALDEALYRLWQEGKYAELYLRFFPVSPF
jgi:polar amino acid transport system substrate-binding protein